MNVTAFGRWVFADNQGKEREVIKVSLNSMNSMSLCPYKKEELGHTLVTDTHRKSDVKKLEEDGNLQDKEHGMPLEAGGQAWDRSVP